jgi:hypothetical protein
MTWTCMRHALINYELQETRFWPAAGRQRFSPLYFRPPCMYFRKKWGTHVHTKTHICVHHTLRNEIILYAKIDLAIVKIQLT